MGKEVIHREVIREENIRRDLKEELLMKQNITKYLLKEMLVRMGICAVIYVFLDIPFRTMGFLNLLPVAGPKNVLPMVTGIISGPAGICGSVTGALISGGLSGASWMETIAEAVSVAVAAIFFSCFWYFGQSSTRKADLKSVRHMIRFFLTGAMAGFVMGGLEGILLADNCESGFVVLLLEVGISSSAWLLLIGMPVFILLTSVFAIQPWRPGQRLAARDADAAKDLVLDIGSDLQELAVVGDAVEQYNKQTGITAQRGYAIMSCVEELSVLIQQQLPENGNIHIHISSGSNVVVRLHYQGERYNPFAVRMAPGGPGANLDILGILMVREMAVHVGYRQKRGGNELTIVV